MLTQFLYPTIHSRENPALMSSKHIQNHIYCNLLRAITSRPRSFLLTVLYHSLNGDYPCSCARADLTNYQVCVCVSARVTWPKYIDIKSHGIKHAHVMKSCDVTAVLHYAYR